jgi:HrpA-like RNA helicase
MAGWDHTKNLPIKRATVLVFLPGLLEIQTVHEALRFPRGKPDSAKFNLDDFDECQKCNYDIIPLHSDLSMDDQMSIFTPAKSTYRKVFHIQIFKYHFESHQMYSKNGNQEQKGSV